MTRDLLRLLAIHLFGNALLLFLGYYWLGIGESDGLHLVWSFAVLGFIGASAVWLHSSTLAFFGSSDRSLLHSCGLALRHLAPLLLVALTGAALYGALFWLFGKLEHTGFLIASFVTLKTRRPLAPDQVIGFYHALLWLLRWLVLPMLLFTVATNVARKGWAGFHWGRPSTRRSLLLAVFVCALLVIALVLPFKLLAWVPNFSGFSMQMVSLALRMGLGYLLFVGSLLAVEFMTAGGIPVRSHPSTVPSP